MAASSTFLEMTSQRRISPVLEDLLSYLNSGNHMVHLAEVMKRLTNCKTPAFNGIRVFTLSTVGDIPNSRSLTMGGRLFAGRLLTDLSKVITQIVRLIYNPEVS